MKDLVACAEKIAKHLTEAKQTIAIAESSTGGLISAALIAVPGLMLLTILGRVHFRAGSQLEAQNSPAL